MYFQLVSLTKIKSQATFATKISLVVLDKSHETLVTNDKGLLDEIKNQQIKVHPFTPFSTYYHM
jgi:hypothetical protein